MASSLVICAIFRDEARALLEWIAYHRVIGFDRFVLYDNGSTDGGAEVIRQSPFADRVTVIHWPQRPGQLTAYKHFIDIFAPAYEWAAFIDVDEFILPLGEAGIRDVLGRCGSASGMLVNWRVFGPAGREEPAPGLVIETYDLRVEDGLPVNRHVKSIVRCADLLDVTENPHEFRLAGPVCNALGQVVPNASVQPAACHEALVINRYFTRSRQEWQAKLARGDANLDPTAPQYTEDLFDQLAAVCQVKDDAIKAYAPQVRQLLGAAGASPAATAPAETTPPPAQSPLPTAVFGGEVGRFAVSAPTGPAPGWAACGPDAQEQDAGLALVFRDRSRPGEPWLAALRGDAATLIDPTFLLDETGRLRDFPTDADARAACDAALARFVAQ